MTTSIVPKEPTLFEATFTDEFVEVVTDIMETVETNNGLMSRPLAMQGYMFDRDENFVYLSEAPVEIPKVAIPIKSIKAIMVLEGVSNNDEYDHILKDFDPKKSKKDAN